MKKSGNTQIILRPKRQVTLPKDICERLGIVSGDVLEVFIEGQTMIAKPKKTRSLDALKTIQAAFKKAEISEKELLETGRIERGRIVRDHYGPKS